MRNFSKMTFDELVCHKENIELMCSGWKRCKDGSYEASLNGYGYFDLLEEINKRKTEALKRVSREE